MAFETKEEILEKLLSGQRPNCPHCGVEMNIWEVPPVSFSDGLGWGVPYLFICFNDECPMYLEGWENLKENYGRNASYRCMQYPDSDHYECLPVFSAAGASGQIVDEEVIARQEASREAIKIGFLTLAECFSAKDGETVLTLLLDSRQPQKVRIKAAEMIGDIGGVEAVEPLRNHKFGTPVLQNLAEDSIKKIHERFFTRECPFCAEIIKKRANVCKHCGKEVAGR